VSKIVALKYEDLCRAEVIRLRVKQQIKLPPSQSRGAGLVFECGNTTASA
jgi:hypothetical protein